MPDQTSCVYCRRIGLVRTEHVIKAGNAAIEHYCGNCERSWTVSDDEAHQRQVPIRGSAAEPPERSRS
jgi:hypothetical protein